MLLRDWLNMIKLINHILGIQYPFYTRCLLSCTVFFFFLFVVHRSLACSSGGIGPLSGRWRSQVNR